MALTAYNSAPKRQPVRAAVLHASALFFKGGFAGTFLARLRSLLSVGEIIYL